MTFHLLDEDPSLFKMVTGVDGEVLRRNLQQVVQWTNTISLGEDKWSSVSEGYKTTFTEDILGNSILVIYLSCLFLFFLEIFLWTFRGISYFSFLTNSFSWRSFWVVINISVAKGFFLVSWDSEFLILIA